jgi:D-3-phosphoglycerate dehydrogenase / 2-oxoglutarate reductase
MSRAPKVVVTDRKFPSYDIERSVLEPLGVQFEVHECRSGEEVLAVAADADVLMVSWIHITADVIEQLTRCRGIIRYGVGYEMLDTDAAARRGIPVINVPDYCTDEVADHAMLLVLALTRKLPQVTDEVRAGRWAGAPCRPIHALRDTTLGLFGIGRIGSAVIERARAFGFRLQANDPYAPAELFERLGVERVDFDTLIATSDVLSLHSPLTDATWHVIDGPVIARMPEGSWLVNVSRGGLIDEDALAEALDSGRLAGAALDVFEQEPLAMDSPLRTAPGLIATSHCAWYSEASFERLQRFAALEAARLVRGEPAKHVVNGVVAGSPA